MEHTFQDSGQERQQQQSHQDFQQQQQHDEDEHEHVVEEKKEDEQSNGNSSNEQEEQKTKQEPEQKVQNAEEFVGMTSAEVETKITNDDAKARKVLDTSADSRVSSSDSSPE